MAINWQDTANQELGGLAPGVISRLQSINPNYDWSGDISSYVPKLNAAYGSDWMDPSRGSSEGFVSALLKDEAARGTPWASAALPGQEQLQNSQQNQIQQSQVKKRGGLGGLGTIAALVAAAYGMPKFLGAGEMAAIPAATDTAGALAQLGIVDAGVGAGASTLAGSPLQLAQAAGMVDSPVGDIPFSDPSNYDYQNSFDTQAADAGSGIPDGTMTQSPAPVTEMGSIYNPSSQSGGPLFPGLESFVKDNPTLAKLGLSVGAGGLQLLSNMNSAKQNKANTQRLLDMQTANQTARDNPAPFTGVGGVLGGLDSAGFGRGFAGPGLQPRVYSGVSPVAEGSTDSSERLMTKPRMAARGGEIEGTGGGLSMMREAMVHGEGGGQQDNIPAMLSPKEYVMDADVVAALGDGNPDEGARKLDEFRERLRKHKRSAPAHKIPPKAKPVEAYLRRAA